MQPLEIPRTILPEKLLEPPETPRKSLEGFWNVLCHSETLRPPGTLMERPGTIGKPLKRSETPRNAP